MSATATPSFTDTASFTVSPTVTQTPQPEPWFATVSLYNAAGELVRVLYSGSSQNAPSSVDFSSGVLAGPGQPITLAISGLVSASLSGPLTWNGTNDTGQPVANGTYYFKVEARDSFGGTVSVVRAVAVAGNQGENSLGLYNSAGELVREIALPAGVTATDLSAPQGGVLVLGGSGLPLLLRDANANPLNWSFDGQSSLGAPLESGTYTLRLLHLESGTQSVIKAIPITILAAPDGSAAASAASAVLGPNPLRSKADTLSLRFLPRSSGGARAGLYNVAGELIAQAWVSASAGKLEIKVGALASGIYAVEFDINEGNRVLSRKALKFVIVK